MSKHTTFFGKVFGWIGDLFHKIEKDLKPIILPFISHILQTIKQVVDNPLIEELVSFIPGDLPEEIFHKFKEFLPKLVLEFGLVVDLSNAHTQEEVSAALLAVFKEFKWESDVAKQKFLSSFGARILQEIKDHEMTFAQAIIDIEFFYEHYVKTQPED